MDRSTRSLPAQLLAGVTARGLVTREGMLYASFALPIDVPPERSRRSIAGYLYFTVVYTPAGGGEEQTLYVPVGMRIATEAGERELVLALHLPATVEVREVVFTDLTPTRPGTGTRGSCAAVGFAYPSGEHGARPRVRHDN